MNILFYPDWSASGRYEIRCLTPMKRNYRCVVYRRLYGWLGLRILWNPALDHVRKTWPPHHKSHN